MGWLFNQIKLFCKYWPYSFVRLQPNVTLCFSGVSSRSSFDKHIVTVSAVDYDATGTGVVKYRLMNTITNNAGQPLFGIHDTFGVISNKVLMRQYTDNIFDLIVNARDRENIALAESVNTTVTVSVFKKSFIRASRWWNLHRSITGLPANTVA